MPAPRRSSAWSARLGFDGNPLRRTTDWLESATTVALLALFVVLAPLLAMFAGQWAYAKGNAAEHVQSADRQRIEGTVLKREPDRVSAPDGVTLRTRGLVRWTGPDGRSHRDQTRVDPGSTRGDTVTLWVDGSGELVSPPLTRAQVVSNAVTMGLLTVVLTGGVLGGVWYLARRRFDRSRMADWDADWAAYDQRWTDRL